jgi:two-component system, LytTR family, response regulator
MGSRLVVKSGRKTLLLQPENIEWVEAERDHVRLHQGRESFLVRSTISRFSELLDPRDFMRVHRSTVVNLNHVSEMRALNTGDYEILLDNKTRLLMSRGYRKALQGLLQTAGLNAIAPLTQSRGPQL